MKIKVTKRSALVFMMTLLVFLDMEPFFVWSHITPIGYRFYTLVILFTTAYMCWSVLNKRILVSGIPRVDNTRSIPGELMLGSAGLLVILLYQFFLSGNETETAQPFNLSMVCVYIGLMMFCLQDHSMLQSVFQSSRRLFAITLVPSLIFLVLRQVNIDFPSVTMMGEEGRAMSGQYYELIMGIAVRVRNTNSALDRICGIYREPGFVGTVGALFLVADNFDLKKWDNKVIFITSFLTFSLAFVVLMIIGYVLRAVAKMETPKKIIRGLVFVVGFLLAYVLFMSIPFESGSMIGELQSRMLITEAGLSGDNRFGGSLDAMIAYDEFIRGDTKTILLGYGLDTSVVSGTEISIWQKVSSYKEYIFQFGLIGFGLLIVWLITTVSTKYKYVSQSAKWKILVLLIVFLASIYQRPNVDRFYYFCLLFGGASNLALLEKGRPVKEGK